SGGTLSIGSDNNIGSGTNTLDGGTLLLTGTSYSKAWTLGVGSNVINDNGNAVSFGGILSGAGGFAKNGTGTLTLSGANTYTGGTTVNAGTLEFTSTPPAGTITVQSGASVKNSTGGDIVVNGATVAPGATYPDTTAPTVTTVTPSGTGAAASGDIVITFDEAMDTGVAGTVQLNSLPALTGGTWSPGNTVFTVAYSGLTYSTAYTVNISGFKDAAGNTMADDNTHSFTTVAPGTSTGVGETLKADISAYPNPFRGTLHLTGAEGCTLTVFTSTGALVHTQKVTATDEIVSLEHLPTGLYLFRLEKDGKTKTMKIVNRE
ncbi:MAG: autotransporter-associated beta strand repeat-containing protein, partial [Bacteroidales bacterium]|nr:autotransporter-associated beta strand repeat-containing protein [Bacteroidales bacterium]